MRIASEAYCEMKESFNPDSELAVLNILPIAHLFVTEVSGDFVAERLGAVGIVLSLLALGFIMTSSTEKYCRMSEFKFSISS